MKRAGTGIGSGTCRLVAAWVFAGFWAVAGGLPACQEKSGEDPFLLAAEQLVEGVPVEVHSGRLEVRMPAREEAQALCSSLVRGGGGSGSFGNDAWYCASENQVLKAQVATVFGRRRFGPATTTGKNIRLQERSHPGRLTTLVECGGQLRVLHVDVGSGCLLMLQQTEGGVFAVRMEGPEADLAAAGTWDQLGAKHDLQKLRMRMLAAGIGLPAIAPWAGKAELIRRLLTFTPADWGEFQAAFADLEAGNFENRETATGRLKDELGQWQVAVAYGLADPATRPEIKSRLRQAVAAAPDAPLNLAIQSVGTGRLHEDPVSLVRLLTTAADGGGGTPGVPDNAPVFAQLRKVTGQSFSDDPGEWEKWLAGAKVPSRVLESESAPEEEIDETKAAPAAGLQVPVPVPAVSVNVFDSARVELSSLLRLELQDTGRLQLDRGYWAAQFGNRPVPELIEQARNQFAETGLPQGWLNIGRGENVEGIGYPQLLFEKYSDALQLEHPQERAMAGSRTVFWGGVQPVNLNRQFEFESIAGILQLHPEENRNMKGEEKYIALLVEELQETGRMVAFRELPGGEVNLLVIGDGDRVLSFGQLAGGQCWIHCVSGGQVATVTADSAKALLEGEAALMQQRVHTILAEMGIGLGEKAGGPLEITNSVPEK